LVNNENLPVCGMSILPKDAPELIDVTQIAPTILNFFGVSGGLSGKPF